VVVLAAGLGSRFGGPKQLQPVGPTGETLIDYALFDGRRGGFDRAVIVTRPELADRFAAAIARQPPGFEVAIALQHVAPGGKPRGTVDAVLAARNALPGPFAVMNADDFYGSTAYEIAATFLRQPAASHVHANVTFPLAATVPSVGAVIRAICAGDGPRITSLEEVRGIERGGEAIVAGERRFHGAERVSMNFWAFRSSILPELQEVFDRYMARHRTDPGAELPLPEGIDPLLRTGRIELRRLEARGPWLGLTHLDDLASVRAGLQKLAAEGRYPTPAW
jgi:choline kinase